MRTFFRALVQAFSSKIIKSLALHSKKEQKTDLYFYRFEQG
jgi:hypothetical protein